jgi:hypothetical protein
MSLKIMKAAGQLPGEVVFEESVFRGMLRDGTRKQTGIPHGVSRGPGLAKSVLLKTMSWEAIFTETAPLYLVFGCVEILVHEVRTLKPWTMPLSTLLPVMWRLFILWLLVWEILLTHCTIWQTKKPTCLIKVSIGVFPAITLKLDLSPKLLVKRVMFWT